MYQQIHLILIINIQYILLWIQRIEKEIFGGNLVLEPYFL